MTSVGETLRREREKRNLDLEQVSHELKIAPRFLEAIEHEQFDRLPGGVFAKSFVRQYARMLDLDEEEAAAEVQRLLAPSSVPLSSLSAPKVAPMPVEFAPRVSSISNRRFGSGSWLPALALVVAVMLGCSLVYGWWQRDHRPVSAASPTPSQTALAQSEIPPQQTPAPPPASTTPANDAPAHTEPVTATPVSQASQTADATPLKAEGAVKVEITTSDEPVWVLARSDGKYAFSGTLEANQTRTVQADGIVLLRIGNAGGVAISVNGKAIPAVGPKGQVRTVQLTSGGFQIVAPPKPAVSPEGLL